MLQEEVWLSAETAGEEDQIRRGRIIGERVHTVPAATAKQAEEFALVEGDKVNVHAGRDDFIVR